MKWLTAMDEKSASKSKGIFDFRFTISDFGFQIGDTDDFVRYIHTQETGDNNDRVAHL